MFNAVERRSYYVKHNLDGLLRGDTAARKEFYGAMLDRGVLSINEVRELENRNAIDGGDMHFVAANNMQPLDTFIKKPEPAPEPQPSNDPNEAELVRSAILATATEAHVYFVRDALDRAYSRESKAATRAIKKGIESFGDWSEEFYGDHSNILAESLTPALLSLAHVLSSVEPDSETRSFIQSHATHTARDIVETTQNELRSRLSCYTGEAGVDVLTRFYTDSSEDSRTVQAKAITEQAAAAIQARLKMQGMN